MEPLLLFDDLSLAKIQHTIKICTKSILSPATLSRCTLENMKIKKFCSNARDVYLSGAVSDLYVVDIDQVMGESKGPGRWLVGAITKSIEMKDVVLRAQKKNWKQHNTGKTYLITVPVRLNTKLDIRYKIGLLIENQGMMKTV